MFEILMYLFESYFNTDGYPELDKLSRKLSAAGFEGDEISEAINWLAELQQQNGDDYPTELSHIGMRFYADFEKQRISSDARQFLMFAEQQGMITAVEREMVIDRAVALNQPSLSEANLKLIMLMVLWSYQKELEPLLVEELLSPLHFGQLH